MFVQTQSSTMPPGRFERSAQRRIISQAQAGDAQAFEWLVQHYQCAVYKCCYRLLPDPAEAEDATQETFLRVYLKLNTYDVSRKFSSWLFAIATNYCLDCLKKRRLSLTNWSALTEDLPSPEEVVTATDSTRFIQSLVHTLHPNYKTVLILKYWQDRRYEEIAEITQTTTGTVKGRLFRARKYLRLMMDNKEEQ